MQSKHDLGTEIADHGGWEEFHQKRHNYTMYDYHKARRLELEREYRRYWANDKRANSSICLSFSLKSYGYQENPVCRVWRTERTDFWYLYRTNGYTGLLGLENVFGSTADLRRELKRLGARLTRIQRYD